MSETETLSKNPSLFTMPAGAVEFGETDSGKKKLRLTLYDGSVVRHWYWGNLAFEQRSMRMAKNRSPILFNHDTDKRIAFSDSREFEPKFTMEGRFLATSNIGQEVSGQMEEGFPFEASLRFDPDRSDIEYVKEGNTSEVNGRKLKGPGTIVRNALIVESSVVVFGALTNTKSQAFASNPVFKEKVIMEKEQLTIETLGEQHPDIRAAVFAEGKAAGIAEAELAAKNRFAELKQVCGDHHELLVACYADGKTVADALKLRAEKAEARTDELSKELAKASETKIDPAEAEFSDQAPAPGTTGEFDEAGATDEQLKERFDKTQDLQDRFSSAEAYVAYVRHLE